MLPPRLSDVLFDLQQTGIYHPRWTEKIEQEFVLHWGHIVKGLKGAALKAYKSAAPHADDERGARQRLGAYRGAVGDEYKLLGFDAQHIVQQVPKKVNSGDTHVVAAAILLKTLLASEGSQFGRNTVRAGANGTEKRWAMRSENRSPRFTTQGDELPIAK